MWRATYRDYRAAHQSICSGEPRWVQDEIASVNGVLSRWLDATAAGYDGEWTNDGLDLLGQGAQTLPQVVKTHEANLVALADCSFAKERAWPSLIARGKEYVEQARDRIEAAEPIREYVRAKAALALWERERPAREFSAKNRCPNRPRVGVAEVYYAAEQQKGDVRYLFCDGSRVVSKDGVLEFQPPLDASRRELKRIKPRTYLEAAKSFANVDRPPELPRHEGERVTSGK